MNMNDGFSGDTPIQICKQYAVGSISKEKLIEKLVRYPYAKGDKTDGYDDLLVDPPGTWSEVSEAHHKGLINDEIYEEVFNQRHNI